MRQTALLPFRRKACWGIFRPEKSNGFGREFGITHGYNRVHPSVVFITLHLRWFTHVSTLSHHSKLHNTLKRDSGVENLKTRQTRVSFSHAQLTFQTDPGLMTELVIQFCCFSTSQPSTLSPDAFWNFVFYFAYYTRHSDTSRPYWIPKTCILNFSTIICHCNTIIEKYIVPKSAIILTPSTRQSYGYGYKRLMSVTHKNNLSLCTEPTVSRLSSGHDRWNIFP